MGDTEMLAEVFSEWGIIAILVAVVILFGSTQLPKFARSLGSAHSEFKKGLAEGAKDSDAKAADADQKASGTESADAKKE
ncbi:MAG: twin-arginine translocase TatA/TatE family subunit [Acidimicrobiales bacterium]